jgi:uncharacterized protein
MKYLSTYFDLIFQNPKKSISLWILLCFISSIGLFQLSTKFGPEVWYKKNDPLMKMYRFFEQEFGHDDTIIISLHQPHGILNKESIKTVKELTQKLYLVHNIIHVDSLANFNWVHSQDDVLEIEPIYGEDSQELNDEFMAQRNKVVMNHPELPGALVSSDFTTTFITGHIKPRFGKNQNFKKIVTETKKLVAPYNESGLEIRLMGSSYLASTMKDVSSGDLILLLPFLLLIIIGLLFIILKSWQVVMIAFCILLATNIMTFGVAGFFDFAFSNLTFIVPIILLAICIADAVHLVSSYYMSFNAKKDTLKALFKSYENNLIPTLMTSVTTAIGFFSLATSNSTPIVEMGVVSGVGVLVAWLATYSLVGPLILILPKFKLKTSALIKESFWSQTAEFIVHRKWAILVAFMILSISSIVLVGKNRVDVNPFDQFSKESDIWKTNQFIKDKIGGVNGPEIVIDSGRNEGAKSPEFLSRVDQLANWIANQDGVNKVSSLLDYLKQMNKTLHNDQDEYYKLPPSTQAVAESLLLLTMDAHQADRIRSKISINNRYLRMTVLWNIYYAKKGMASLDKMLKKAKDLGLNATATGKQGLSIHMVDYIFETFKSSIGLSLIIITLVIMLGIRSGKLGLLSLIPNIFPLLAGASWIYLSGLFIDFSCVVAFVISLGIAVDDTIHFLVAYKEYEKGRSATETLKLVFSKCGNGIALTTVILVLGFGSLLFSNFLANYKLGLLTIIVLSTALIADFLFLPALLAIMKKDSSPNDFDSTKNEELRPAKI